MINVTCLKHGSKYDYQYVNKLYNMVKRHLTLPFKFWCFTENPQNLDHNINIQSLPNKNLSGWWYKPYFFKKGLFPPNEIILYLDLDLVIINNIDKLFSYIPDEFLGLRDPLRKFNPSQKTLNSSVMRWNTDSFCCLWENIENNNQLCNNYKGDQDYIFDVCKQDIKYFPDEWVLSYKWEVRERSELTTSKPRNFVNTRNPYVSKETSILVFHGNPKIHMVQDEIIKNNWI